MHLTSVMSVSGRGEPSLRTHKVLLEIWMLQLLRRSRSSPVFNFRHIPPELLGPKIEASRSLKHLCWSKSHAIQYKGVPQNDL